MGRSDDRDSDLCGAVIRSGWIIRMVRLIGKVEIETEVG